MHELSLAMSIVATATELARQQGAARVIDVTLRIGRLSCVHEEALRSSFMIFLKTLTAWKTSPRIMLMC